MRLADFISGSTSALETLYPAREAARIAVLLCEERLGVKSWTHITEPGFEIDAGALERDMERLLAAEPIQYVLGKAWFCGREFKVGPGVLIPRPETEQLVELAEEAASCLGDCNLAGAPLAAEESRLSPKCGSLSARQGFASSPRRILDLCTGSGCIAWTLALNAAGKGIPVEVTAVDVSDKALSIAASQPFCDGPVGNAAYGRPMIKFMKADLLGDIPEFLLAAGVMSGSHRGEETADCVRPLGNATGGFDVIVSNPPYVMEGEKAQMRANVLDYEPSMALFVPNDDPLVFYRAIAGWAARLLRPGGFCAVEINEALGKETAALFENYTEQSCGDASDCSRDAMFAGAFQDIRIEKDLFGKDRFVTFRKRPATTGEPLSTDIPKLSFCK